MKVKDLREIVGIWDATSTEEDVNTTSRYLNILKQLEFLGSGEWANYLPAHSPRFSKEFMARLAAWIGNVDKTVHQQLLLEYAQRLCFFSHEDFLALYRSAFNGPITRWVIEKAGLRFDSPDFSDRLDSELYKRTWYCPITDSMDINEFYHVNHISGVEHRPSFATLAMLDPLKGTPNLILLERLQHFLNNPDRYGRHRPLRRLVLLEDFVGSGTQMAAAIKWAATKLQIPILVVPLIICAPGKIAMDKLIKIYINSVAASPIIHLDASELLGPRNKGGSSWPRYLDMEALALEVSAKMGPKPAFGYKKTGCSVVTYSNTPNNSLPLIHQRTKTGTWSPLFPRASRI